MDITELNTQLPQHLHLTASPRLDQALDQASTKGWEPNTLGAYLRGQIGPRTGTGAVVWMIENTPTPTTENGRAGPTIPKWAAHTPCPDNHKGMWQQPCELCHCDPNQPPQHHVETDAWWGWPDLTKKPDDYGPGWLRNPPTQHNNTTPPLSPSLPF